MGEKPFVKKDVRQTSWADKLKNEITKPTTIHLENDLESMDPWKDRTGALELPDLRQAREEAKKR
jgi:hypothetical protein